MFDGSVRAKREINLAGKGSSKSSRKSNLAAAKQQRLKRAEIKARQNATKRIQRCWRGSVCRKTRGAELREEFIAIQDIASLGDSAKQKAAKRRACSLLAFRIAPPLLPFYAGDATGVRGTSTTCNKRGDRDPFAEREIRQDLLTMQQLLEQSRDAVSPVAARRIFATALILLRQSAHQQRHGISAHDEIENQRLVQLMTHILDSKFSTMPELLRGWGASFGVSYRPSDYYMGVLCENKKTGPFGSIAALIILCFRDFALLYVNDNNRPAGVFILKSMLDLCCDAIVQLSISEVDVERNIPYQYQQGLALLATTLFACTSRVDADFNGWENERMSCCVREIFVKKKHSACLSWRPLAIHYLATCMQVEESQLYRGGHLPGPVSNLHPLLGGLKETLSTREFAVVGAVFSSASSPKNGLESEILAFSIPSILAYALRHQQELALLVCSAAQGEDIAGLMSRKTLNRQSSDAEAIAIATAAAAICENVDTSEDEDEEPPTQQRQISMLTSNITATKVYSRSELLTIPKLDDLYHNNFHNAKKQILERLQAPASEGRVKQLISLAQQIGKGDILRQLSARLFSTSFSDSALSCHRAVLEPLNVMAWQERARKSYSSALAICMTNLSGAKAGRNAASPLLANLAFDQSFLDTLWDGLIRWQPSQSDDAATTIASFEAFTSFCDAFAHNLLTVSDDDFLQRHNGVSSGIVAKDVVLKLKLVLSDLYWGRPVVAADLSASGNSLDSALRFQRARLLLSGTKLFNSLHERWSRLYRDVVQFCAEDCWWFSYLASRGSHDNSPLARGQNNSQMNADDPMDSSDDEGDMPRGSTDTDGDALADNFRDAKMARVLTAVPQAMPFNRRVNMFNYLIEADKARTQDESGVMRQIMQAMQDGEEEPEIPGRENVTIRRHELYSDSKRTLNRLGKRLKKRVQVTFINEHGMQEAGIDGGGVFKEFIDDLIKNIFIPAERPNDKDSHPEFFTVTPIQTLNVNGALDESPDTLSNFVFAGRVLGKAIYESILVEPQFCFPFLNKLLGRQNSLDDLKNLDPEYFRNLKSLQHMSSDEIDSLGLTFETEGANSISVELLPNGSNIPVTKKVIQYIHLVSHQKMNVSGSRQTHAFLSGFRDMIPSHHVRLFSAYELQKIISGDDAVKGIDVQSFMNVVRYSGGYHPTQSIMLWFWQVVAEMTPQQQRLFLKFMTSCSRQPLLGFGSMNPPPCIQQIRLLEDARGRDVAEGAAAGNGHVRLPSSSTCMNLLKLPKYTSKEMLREKLLYAIESSAGFELS